MILNYFEQTFKVILIFLFSGNFIDVTSMSDSTKVPCPLLTKLRILITGDSPSIFTSLEDKM